METRYVIATYFFEWNTLEYTKNGISRVVPKMFRGCAKVKFGEGYSVIDQLRNLHEGRIVERITIHF